MFSQSGKTLQKDTCCWCLFFHFGKRHMWQIFVFFHSGKHTCGRYMFFQNWKKHTSSYIYIYIFISLSSSRPKKSENLYRKSLLKMRFCSVFSTFPKKNYTMIFIINQNKNDKKRVFLAKFNWFLWTIFFWVLSLEIFTIF